MQLIVGFRYVLRLNLYLCKWVVGCKIEKL